MSNISLTFVAHQPNRLIHYDFFKIGEHAFYEDDDLNARVLSTVAERCYFPATRLMKQLIELTGGKFRFGLALSGVILEQAGPDCRIQGSGGNRLCGLSGNALLQFPGIRLLPSGICRTD